MNQDQLLMLLSHLFSKVKYHPKVIEELLYLLANSGAESRFRKIFLTRISQLQNLGRDAIRLQEFEHINSELYSMHLSANRLFNIRLLYSHLSDETVIFLHAFYEREGKKRTDYTNAIPLAQRRLSEWRDTYE